MPHVFGTITSQPENKLPFLTLNILLLRELCTSRMGILLKSVTLRSEPGIRCLLRSLFISCVDILHLFRLSITSRSQISDLDNTFVCSTFFKSETNKTATHKNKTSTIVFLVSNHTRVCLKAFCTARQTSDLIFSCLGFIERLLFRQ